MSAAIDAILFDLDGTLIDSGVDIYQAVQNTAAKTNKDLLSLGLDLKKVKTLISTGSFNITKTLNLELVAEDIYADLSPAEILKLDTPLVAAHKALLEEYMQILDLGQVSTFEGVYAALAVLDANLIPWGIVTNKFAKTTKKTFDIAFSGLKPKTIICGDHSKNSKPAPDHLLFGLDEINLALGRCIKPCNTLYVGDHPIDAKAATTAGMQLAIVDFGYLDTHELQGLKQDYKLEYIWDTVAKMQNFFLSLR